MHDIDMLLGNKVSNKGQHAVRRYPGAGQFDFLSLYKEYHMTLDYFTPIANAGQVSICYV